VAPHPEALIREQRDLNGPVLVSSAEIESSQQISNENNCRRQKRAFDVTAYSTLTITSYSIVTTTSTKVVTLGKTDGVACEACVGCLPPGISICK
jgi:hypothetical protein